jgi:hypothetical protein
MSGGAGIGDSFVIGDGDMGGVKGRLGGRIAIVQAIAYDDGGIVIVMRWYIGVA